LYKEQKTGEDSMKRIPTSIACLLCCLFVLAAVCQAGAADPLFVNLTSDDGHRSLMAISFGQNQLQRGHPLTVYLNDKAVLIASKKNGGQFAQQQALLQQIVAMGGAVLVCPMCSQKYGVAESDFLDGAKLTNPDRTGAALFVDNTRTLSW
jgi:sulfur relay (sulfurtransferase) complex TusBCD TusD component (DsrE family)